IFPGRGRSRAPAPAHRLHHRGAQRGSGRRGIPQGLAETVVFCKDLGHRVEEADPEIDRASVVPTFLTFAAANMVVNLASHPTAGRSARKGEVENVTWGTAQKGEQISAADYVRATQA